MAKLFELASEIVKGHMLDHGRIINIAHYAMQSSVLPGDMVEFGCYSGNTAALLAQLVDKPLWLYDSFEGLPERSAQDQDALPHYHRGSFTLESNQDAVLRLFESHNLRKPFIHKGWFCDVTPGMVPDKICFAHLDGDFYESVRDSLRLVYPKLVKGAACIIDDYGWSGLPGAKSAVDEFLADKPEKAKKLVTGGWDQCHAVFVKL